MYNWKNFDIELFDHEKNGDSVTVKVRVARTPDSGEQRDAVSVEIPKALAVAAKKLENDELNLQQTIELGEMLAEILLPTEAAKLFKSSLTKLKTDEGLRLRIILRSVSLANLPWEYVYRRSDSFDKKFPERGFLGLNRSISIVRYEPLAQAPGNFSSLKKDNIKVSMLLANPDVPGMASLDLENEVTAVKNAIGDEPGVELFITPKATNDDLNDSLDSRPHIFHFAGHGRFKMQSMNVFGEYSGKGELLFETKTGGVDAVDANELAVKMRNSGVRLAVLNNCESARRDSINAFSGIAPSLVRDGVPAVIAMQFNIRDEHAIQFAQRLYHNLAAHKSLDHAVTSARLAMFETGDTYSRDWGIPVLYLRSEDSVLFPDPLAANIGRLGKLGVINIILATSLVFVLAFFYREFIEPRLLFSTVISGVLIFATLAAVGFLKTVVGDSIRGRLQNWLRRKSATGVLASALSVMIISFFILSPPRYIRVVPDIGLIGKIPKSGVEITQAYRLIINAVEYDDFRKSGVILAGSHSDATRLSKRKGFVAEIEKDLTTHMRKLGLLEDSHQKFLNLWQESPSKIKLSRLGKIKELNIRLMRGDEIKSCQTIELSKKVNVIFLQDMQMESQHEC